jgi:hypothetical protein
VIEALRPFIVTSWYVPNDGKIPSDVAGFQRAAGLAPFPNVKCYVLDAQGRLVRGFHPFPEGRDGMRSDPGDAEGQSRLVKAEIVRASEQLGLRPVSGDPRGLRLPTVDGKGVRVFVRFEGGAAPFNYRTPVVDAVAATDEESAALASKEFPADKLKRWFAPLFPPALMEERTCVFRRVTGTLAARDGVIRGEVGLVMDDDRETTLRGMFEAAVSSGELRGVFEGEYTRNDPRRREGPLRGRVRAAFEGISP